MGEHIDLSKFGITPFDPAVSAITDDDLAKTRMLAAIEEHVARLRAAEDLLIEQACEEALQGGEWGVLVLRNNEGLMVWARPHPNVPYGQMYVGRWDANLPSRGD